MLATLLSTEPKAEHFKEKSIERFYTIHEFY